MERMGDIIGERFWEGLGNLEKEKRSRKENRNYNKNRRRNSKSKGYLEMEKDLA